MFRNMLKRITSVALAFALIGAGSAIEMKTNSQEAALHTAHAISRAQCRNHGQYTNTSRGKCVLTEIVSHWGGLWSDYHARYRYDVTCASCGTLMYSYYEDVWYPWDY